MKSTHRSPTIPGAENEVKINSTRNQTDEQDIGNPSQVVHNQVLTIEKSGNRDYGKGKKFQKQKTEMAKSTLIMINRTLMQGFVKKMQAIIMR